MSRVSTTLNSPEHNFRMGENEKKKRFSLLSFERIRTKKNTKMEHTCVPMGSKMNHFDYQDDIMHIYDINKLRWMREKKVVRKKKLLVFDTFDSIQSSISDPKIKFDHKYGRQILGLDLNSYLQRSIRDKSSKSDWKISKKNIRSVEIGFKSVWLL